MTEQEFYREAEALMEAFDDDELSYDEFCSAYDSLYETYSNAS